MAEAARRTRILLAIASIALAQFTSVAAQEPEKYDAEGNLQSNKLRGNLEVTQYANSTHNDDIYIGQMVRMKLTVNFSDLPEATDTKVTIILSSTASPILGFTPIYSPIVGKGLIASIPQKDRSSWGRYYVETAVPKSVSYFTTLIHYFGNVTHIDTENAGKPSDLIITVGVACVCFGDNDVAIGESFNTTAKTETNDESLKFTQTFVYQGIKTVDDEPSFNLTEVTEIEVLKPLILQLDMFLPSPLNNAEITVDASTQFETDVYNPGHAASDPAKDDKRPVGSFEGLLIQDIKCVGSGRAFDYALNEDLVKVAGYKTCPLSPILNLEVGPLVNTESQKENPSRDDNLLSFNATLLITDAIINRSEVSVGVTVKVNSKTMWASSLRLTVLGPAQTTNQESDRYPSLSLDSSEPTERMVTTMIVSSGTKSSFALRLETQPASNRTYTLTITTYEDVSNNKRNALRILAVVPEDTGSNLVCQLDNPVELMNRSEEDPSMWSWSYMLQIFNLGIHDDALANTMKIGVNVVMLGNAMKDDTFTLTSYIDNKTGPIVSFTVDAPAKASYALFSTFSPASYRHPGFLSFVLHTPPGTNDAYNVTLYSNPPGASHQMNILAVNLLGAGANVAESVKLEDIAVNLASSMNNSDMDLATLNLVVRNTGENAESGADDVNLEIVVLFEPTAWYILHRPGSLIYGWLKATVNDIVVAHIRTISRINNLEYDDSFSVFESPDQCPGNVFSYGSVVRLLMKVVTYPDSTVGPLRIAIQWGPYFTVENASVVSKGRNVVCVNIGPIITTQEAMSSSANYTVLTLPMVCNRQRSPEFESDDISDPDSGDILTIELYLAQNGSDETSPGPAEQEVNFGVGFETEKSMQVALFPTMHLVDHWHDHGQLKVIEKVHLVDHGQLSQNRGDYVLEWSMNGTDNVLTTLTTYSEEDGASYLRPAQFPVFARFFRVLRRDDACFMNVTTTSVDLPIIHGPTDKTEPLLTNVLRMLVASSHHGGPCMPLPQPGDTETTPFLWIDIKSDLFRVKSSSRSFGVALRGTGIQCNSRTGPQITMVVFPKERPAKNGEQQHELCEVINDFITDYGQTVCHYKCECETASECEQMTLLMTNVQKTQAEKKMGQMKSENGGAGMSNHGSQEQFSLCQFHIWQYQV